jgi:hypothetical protein
VAGTKVKLTQTTDYPWSGAIRIGVTPAAPAKFTVRVRIPGWATNDPVPSNLYTYDDDVVPAWSVKVGESPVKSQLEDGYVAITREWRAGDTIDLDFALPVRSVRGHERIADLQGRVAFERGPVVYCVEAPERKFIPGEIAVSAAAKLGVETPKDLFGGVPVVQIRDGAATTTAIPYFLWNNRGNAPMAVWLMRSH